MASALVVGCQQGRQPAPRIPVVQSQRLETAEFQASFDTVSTLEAEEEVDLAAQAGAAFSDCWWLKEIGCARASCCWCSTRPS